MIKPASDPDESLPQWLQFIEENFGEQHQDAARKYVTQLQQRGLPVVFDMTHLARRIALPVGLVRSLVASPKNFYRTFAIPKRSGGHREIQSPFPSALLVQYWIASHVLVKLPISASAHGFAAGRSTVTNARVHLGARCVLRMDIKDFFPSIKLPRVIALFQWAGYCDEASYAMARCCLLEDRLPQGAATSPLIANLVSWRLDARLSALARSFALRYSRYADDMVFSGDRISAGVSRVVESVVRSEGFQINAEKTYLARGQKKKVVTGINVSSEVTRLPRSKRRAFRAFAHRALNDPLGRSPDAAQRRDPQHLQRLLASLAYWIQVEPSSAVARGYHQRTKELVAQLRQATVLPDPNPPQAP